jgi:glycosyltransferase involved in cell wall biosynthesis
LDDKNHQGQLLVFNLAIIMKIFYIVDEFNAGGREKVIADLANFSFKSGHDVTVLLLDGFKSQYSTFLEKGVYLKKFNLLNNGSFSLNPMDYVTLGLFLNKHKPDIIHYHIYAFRLLMCAFISKIFFIRSVNVRTVHTSGLFYDENNRSLVNKLRLASEKIATKVSGYLVIGISKKIHNNNIRFFKSQAHDLIQIYNGLDVLSYHHQDDSRESNEVVFVYVARLVEGKNHDFLVQVWASFVRNHEKAKLLIAGDGELKEKLLLQVESLNLSDSIIFLGHISNINSVLAGAHIALFPSSYEGFSITLLEYFASSLPVIAHDIPAFNEISTNGENIMLIPLFDKEKYLESMSLLYSDVSLRHLIGCNARLVSENYSLEVFQERHMSLYRQLISGEY